MYKYIIMNTVFMIHIYNVHKTFFFFYLIVAILLENQNTYQKKARHIV